MARSNEHALTDLVGIRFPVLDKGHVILLDVMGSDEDIAAAARTSFGKGTRKVSEDETLIRYLMRHRHTTPFEMAEIKIHVRVPTDTWRQWIRHRTASVNEYSTRYSEAIDDKQETAPEDWRLQSTANKQGSSGFVEDWPEGERWSGVKGNFTPGSFLSAAEAGFHVAAEQLYKDRLSFGVAREQARKDLPLSTYCYDAATEVLTDRGFAPWPNVKDGDKIGIWDKAKSSLVYETPEYLTRDYYRGRMYRVDHKSIDLLVTPNHKMYVRRRGDFELVPAEELGDRTLVRYIKTAGYLGPDDWASGDIPVLDSRALLSLYGFFIGDGCAPKSGDKNAIVFSLRRQRKIDYLKYLCNATGLEFDIRGVHFLVRHQGITDYFRKMFYDENDAKRVPDFMLKMNAEDSFAVLEGFRNSDGNTKTKGAWRFDSTSKQVAESAAIIGVHAGRPVNIMKPTLKDFPSSDVYHVSFLSNESIQPVINQMTRNTSWEEYDGYVYCAKTRTGVMVVRRNGKVALSGNTEAVWKCDLKNTLGFLSLRMDSHAQLEIRQYANVIGNEIVAKLFPQTWQAFLDYQLNAVTLSAVELEVLERLQKGDNSFSTIKNQRERDECIAKLERIGLY